LGEAGENEIDVDVEDVGDLPIAQAGQHGEEQDLAMVER